MPFFWPENGLSNGKRQSEPHLLVATPVQLQPERRSKTVFIKSYGCQMNRYDSQRMADALAPDGYTETACMEEADLVILNTCHIREKAAEKVYSELGRLRLAKTARRGVGRQMTVAVAGCVAQAEGEEILRRAPVVDLVVGPQTYHRLPDLVKAAKIKPGVIDTEFPLEDKFGILPQPSSRQMRARGPSAFVTVQEGCDKFCTFCVVPYTRGAEASRPVLNIIEDATRLAQAGVRELQLLGQNVNAYHGEGPDGRSWTLGELLRRLAEIPGIARLRYTTSHPRDMDENLIAAHRDLPQLMPFLHLPIQSGSDRILVAMSRRHSARDYLRVIERMRKARPDIAFSSDFIVGFPGESEADFSRTLRLIEEVRYVSAYSFKYSPRPGTPAAGMADQVDEAVKAERLARLQALTEGQQKTFNTASVGQTMDVLLERPGRKAGQLAGRSPYLQAVQIEAGTDLIGEVVPVNITATGTWSLYGEVKKPSDERRIAI